jgi:hypothetical protein
MGPLCAKRGKLSANLRKVSALFFQRFTEKVGWEGIAGSAGSYLAIWAFFGSDPYLWSSRAIPCQLSDTCHAPEIKGDTSFTSGAILRI